MTFCKVGARIWSGPSRAARESRRRPAVTEHAGTDAPPVRSVMYWSVWASAQTARGRIESAAMDASGRRTLLDAELHWPNGLALVLPERYLYW